MQVTEFLCRVMGPPSGKGRRLFWTIAHSQLRKGDQPKLRRIIMASSGNINWNDGDDEEMMEASAKARACFRFFWWQVASDFNRIVPAWDFSCVKAAFCDGEPGPDSPVEHMWVMELNFDGENITGTLGSNPHWVKSVKEGDQVTIPLGEITDWMCAADDLVYGAFTVQLMRKRMEPEEREQHDGMWGLNFPDPDEVRIPEIAEEFDRNLSGMIKAEQVEAMLQPDELGRNALHREALCGRLHCATRLVELGLPKDAKCHKGWTPFDYANNVGWQELAEVLKI